MHLPGDKGPLVCEEHYQMLLWRIFRSSDYFNTVKFVGLTDIIQREIKMNATAVKMSVVVILCLFMNLLSCFCAICASEQPTNLIAEPSPFVTPTPGAPLQIWGYVEDKNTCDGIVGVKVTMKVENPFQPGSKSNISFQAGEYWVIWGDGENSWIDVIARHSGYVQESTFAFCTSVARIDFDLTKVPVTFRHSGDYNGDGSSDIAIFNNSSGLWKIAGITNCYFGSRGDAVVSGDYDGNSTADMCVFRAEDGLWAIKNWSRYYFGAEDDLSVPGDYNGDGTTDGAIFRPGSGLWLIKGVSRAYFGREKDIPLQGDYLLSGRTEIAVFRPSAGLWLIKDVSRIYFGGESDLPVPGDYNGDGTHDCGIFRPSNSMWAIRNITRIYFGKISDWAIPADYSGAGSAMIAIYRENTGLWAIRGLTRLYFGGNGEVPVTR